MSERRTPDQVRAEIESEREQLAAAIGTLGADAKRTGRMASYAVAAAGGLVTLRKLRRRRKRKKTS